MAATEEMAHQGQLVLRELKESGGIPGDHRDREDPQEQWEHEEQ